MTTFLTCVSPITKLLMTSIVCVSLLPYLIASSSHRTMSQVTWIRGPVCGVDNCRSRIYRLDAGRKFCQFGHIMEDNIEMDDDDGETFVQTKRLNIQLTDTGFGSHSRASQTPAASSIVKTKSRRLHGDDGKVFVCRCLQTVLQRITPMVADHLYACMGPQKTVAVKKSLLSTVRLFWIRAIKRVFTAKTPTIVDLYAIIYLALRHLNAAPFDVAAYLHMMKTNKVPFVNATLLLPPEMIQKMPLPTSYIMLTPVNVPLDDQFYRIVFRWTKILELALVLAPLADCFHYLAYTLFKALRIPQAPTLLLIYHELIWKMTNGVFREIKGPIIGPEVQSVVAMFFVVNLYFRSSPQIVDPRQFVNHVAVAVDEPPYLKNKMHKMDVREVFSLSEKDILQYCDWVYDNVVPNKHKDHGDDASDAEPMDRKLFKIFPYEKSEERASLHYDVSLLPLVPNHLSKTDLAGVSHSLVEYFCNRFGLKKKTLLDYCRRFELELLRVLRAEKFFT